jgi:hypothetical protein
MEGIHWTKLHFLLYFPIDRPKNLPTAAINGGRFGMVFQISGEYHEPFLFS